MNITKRLPNVAHRVTTLPLSVWSGQRGKMCGMHLSLATSYDASPEEVFAMITDVTFQEQVFQQLRAQSYDVTVGD